MFAPKGYVDGLIHRWVPSIRLRGICGSGGHFHSGVSRWWMGWRLCRLDDRHRRRPNLSRQRPRPRPCVRGGMKAIHILARTGWIAGWIEACCWGRSEDACAWTAAGAGAGAE